jgi:activator of HSP90 ATPase
MRDLFPIRCVLIVQDSEKKIVQQWRFRHWPEGTSFHLHQAVEPCLNIRSGHYSHVVISFHETDDETHVSVSQSGVPSAEKDTTKDGWTMHYFNKIKMVFGLGAPLF